MVLLGVHCACACLLRHFTAGCNRWQDDVSELPSSCRNPLLPAADGKMTWLIDFVGYTRANSPPIKVSLQVLHILQVGRGL